MQTWHLNTLLIPSLFANAVKVELIIMISHPEAERVGGFDTPHANEADGERGLWVLDRYLGSSSHVKAEMFSTDRPGGCHGVGEGSIS